MTSLFCVLVLLDVVQNPLWEWDFYIVGLKCFFDFFHCFPMNRPQIRGICPNSDDQIQ